MGELNRRRRLLVLAICCMSLLIVGLDNTIVNVALPSIRRDLNASVSNLQWTIDAYTLVLASFLMLSGSTADRIGRRRIFQIGLTLFSAGSLLCSIAPSVQWLIAFRAMQAIGGSMLNPVAMSIITNTFTNPKERAQAIGVWGGVVGISQALGPIVGGLLIDSIGWRSIFWINVPIGIAAIVLTFMFVPESKSPRPRRIDPVGQLLVIVGLATLTYAIIEGPGFGWTSARIIGLFVVSVLAVIGLVLYERRRAEPLIDVRFFRSIPFSGATVIAVCAFASLAGFLFVNTLYLQDVRGYSALASGLYTLPLALMTVFFGPLSGRIVGARGPRVSLLVAGAGLLACALILTNLTNDTSMLLLIVAYLLFGIGFGTVNPPITNTAVSGMPIQQAGVAAAVASTSRQIGGSLGVAVIGSVVTGSIHGSLPAGLASASHIGWWIVAGCAVVIFCLGLLTTGRWAKRTAVTTMTQLAPEENLAGSAVR
ncbi:MAG TPA: DHA2 family efflux MFS transporter permease subunit [Pseudonocardiaceae bacterium]|nr:DHA2 family efflux MFS transporter permease subunit [Pseudonocardiaceae bacterium]